MLKVIRRSELSRDEYAEFESFDNIFEKFLLDKNKLEQSVQMTLNFGDLISTNDTN